MKYEKRLEEVKVIIKRLYEDNVLGKVTDERFSFLLNDYEIEERSLRDNIIEVRNSMNDLLGKKDNSNLFTNIIQKYTDIKELNAAILNELIQKIVIYECEYIDGKRRQQVDIYYNFVGII